MSRRPVGFVVLLTAACGANGEPPPGNPPSVDAGPPAMSDSLVLVLPGAGIWFTEGRRATDSAGQGCWERGVEIRRDSSRRRVPLLFTGAAPTRLTDTTFRAELYQGCAPRAAYRVNVRDGQPYRITP